MKGIFLFLTSFLFLNFISCNTHENSLVNRTFVKKIFVNTTEITFNTDSTFKYKIVSHPGVGNSVYFNGSGTWVQRNNFILLEDNFIPKSFKIEAIDTTLKDSLCIHLSSLNLSEEIQDLSFCSIMCFYKKRTDTLESDFNGFIYLKEKPIKVKIIYVDYPKYLIDVKLIEETNFIKICLQEPKPYIGKLKLFRHKKEENKLFESKAKKINLKPYELKKNKNSS